MVSEGFQVLSTNRLVLSCRILLTEGVQVLTVFHTLSLFMSNIDDYWFAGLNHIPYSQSILCCRISLTEGVRVLITFHTLSQSSHVENGD